MYRRPGCSRDDRLLTGEERVARRRAPAAGRSRRRRPYSPRTCSAGVAHGGRRRDDQRPHRVLPSDVAPGGTACRPRPRTSPTVVPSAPVIRCSSSWMIRSGGRSRPTGRTVAAWLSVRRVAGRGSCSRVVGVHVPVAARSAPPRSRTATPASPSRASRANLSTVAMTNAGRQPVDLLVHREDRQTLGDLRRPWRTGSQPSSSPQYTKHPLALVVGTHVGRADRGAAPRATLDLQHGQPSARTRLRGPLELLVRLLEPLRDYVRADPQPDTERLVPPHPVTLAAPARPRRPGRSPAGTAGRSAAAACTASARSPRRPRRA